MPETNPFLQEEANPFLDTAPKTSFVDKVIQAVKEVPAAALGTLEAGASVVTGAASAMAAIPGKYSRILAGTPPLEAGQQAAEAAQATTYQPRTEKGKAYADVGNKAAALPFEVLDSIYETAIRPVIDQSALVSGVEGPTGQPKVMAGIKDIGGDPEILHQVLKDALVLKFGADTLKAAAPHGTLRGAVRDILKEVVTEKSKPKPVVLSTPERVQILSDTGKAEQRVGQQIKTERFLSEADKRLAQIREPEANPFLIDNTPEPLAKLGEEIPPPEGMREVKPGEELPTNAEVKVSDGTGKAYTSEPEQAPLKSIPDEINKLAPEEPSSLIVEDNPFLGSRPEAPAENIPLEKTGRSVRSSRLTLPKEVPERSINDQMTGEQAPEAKSFFRDPKDILSDINIALGERGSVGEGEFTSEQTAARERLKADAEVLKKKADEAGETLEKYMQNSGFDEGTIGKLALSTGREANVVDFVPKEVGDFYKKFQDEIATKAEENKGKIEEYKDWRFSEGDRVQSNKTGHTWEINAKFWNTKENKPQYMATDLVDGTKASFNIGMENTFKKFKGPKDSTTLYSDPFLIQSAYEAIKKSGESAREVWERVRDTKFGDATSRTVQAIGEQILEPEEIFSRHPVGKEVFESYANAHYSGNAFLGRHLEEYYKATKGIKKGSPEDMRIGEVLDNTRSADTLTLKERKAYDFFKEEYSVFIETFARRAAGSEEAYQRILKDIKRDVPERSLIADLTPERLAEYEQLKTAAKEIRNGRKVTELSKEELSDFRLAQQEMRDYLSNDYRKSLPEGERQAYDILSRRIEHYLPRLFDQTDLLNKFKTDIKDITKKLETATSPGTITRYKNQLNELNASVKRMSGGKMLTFKQLPKDVFFKFFTERKGATGYDFDAMKAYEAYLYGITRKMFDEPALKHVANDLYPKLPPDLQNYTKKFSDHYMGYDRSEFAPLSNALMTFEWLRALGLNPRSALVNFTQRLNTMVYTGRNTPVWKFAGERYALKAEKMLFTDRALVDDLVQRSGVKREIPEVLTEGPIPDILRRGKAVVGYMYDKMELGNREHGLVAGWLRGLDDGKAKGFTGKALDDYAFKEAMDTMHKTQFRYGKLGMPQMYWSPTNRVMLQFSSYTLKQARFLNQLRKEDPVSLAKYIAYAEGINYTAQQLADVDLSNALGFGITWPEVWKTVESIADGDARGAMRHLSQVPTLGGGILPSGPGPLVTGAIKVATAKPGGHMEALTRELTPVMYDRLKQAYGAVKNEEDGVYPVEDSKNHVNYKFTGKQLLQRTLGPKAAEEGRIAKERTEKVNLEAERRGILTDIVNALVEQDTDKVSSLIEKYGVAPSPQDIKNELMRRSFTREELGKLHIGKPEIYQLQREGRLIGE